MITEFSSGYYLAWMYVKPASGDRATIHQKLLERANKQIYVGSDGDGDDETGEDSTDTSLPGFGIGVALVALVAVTLFALRRR